MAGHISVMFGWTWSEVSVLGSQVFGQSSAESCIALAVSFRLVLACHKKCVKMT